MSQLWSDPWIEAILAAALRGAPLLLLAGAAAIGWRRSSAAARHLMWLVAIACMLALPMLSASLPAPWKTKSTGIGVRRSHDEGTWMR